jgi:hypothetical protein
MISPGAKVRYAAHFGLSADIGVRADRLSKYMMKMYIEGEKDEHRLTCTGCRTFAISIGKSTPVQAKNDASRA